jgi:hypothetical protein
MVAHATRIRQAPLVALLIGLTGGSMALSRADTAPGRPFLPDVFSHHLSYRPQLSLDGPWEFRRDKEDQGPPPHQMPASRR